MRRAFRSYQTFITWYREPEQQKVLYKYRKWFWIVLLLISIPTHLIYSVAFISALSIIALFVGDSSAESAADGAIKAKESLDKG